MSSLDGIRTALLLILSTPLTIAWASDGIVVPDTIRESQHQAVLQARNGQLADSLARIAALRQRYPEDSSLLHDETVILGWADKDTQVLDNARVIDTDTAPIQVLSAVARSARNQLHFEMAATWYAKALEAKPDDVDARLGLAMTLADAGDHNGAATTLDTLKGPDRKREDALLTEAYVHERSGRYLAAVGAYDGILLSDSEHRAALRGKALALRKLLLPQHALALAEEHLGILTADEVARLRTDQAALEVRLGLQMPDTPDERYAGTDRALTQLEQHLETLAAHDDALLATRYDRIVALRHRHRNQEAIDEFEQLLAGGHASPSYVLAAVAGAYLDQRRPEEAHEILTLALADQPSSVELQLAMFYALVELERHDDAVALTDTLVAQAPIWRRKPGSRVIQENPHRTQAEITSSLALAFADQLDAAQRRFEEMLALAPHNTDARQELAGIYRWRGWPDRALFQYRQVLTVAPDHVSARAGYAHALLDRRYFAEAAEQLTGLLERSPQNPAVRRLATRWDVDRRAQIEILARSGESTGQTFGSDQYEVDGYLVSRPMQHRYRAFVHTHDSFAEFEEGDARRQRIGVGVDMQFPDWLASAELSRSRTGSSQIGLRGTVERRLSDQWSVGGELDTHSNLAPLRGHRVGVDGALLGINGTFTANESTGASGSIQHLDLSDGNEHSSLLLSGHTRIINRPVYKLDLIGDLSASWNSMQEVAYYSPRRAASISVGADNRWRMYRRYDRSLTHRVAANLGRKSQKSFSPGTTGAVQYEFIASLSSRLDIRFSVERNRSVYDGETEYSTFFFGGVTGRL